MTTVTREQVNKLLEMIQHHFPSLPLSDAYTDWKKWSEFAQAAFLYGASEARSDLEATNENLEFEVNENKKLALKLGRDCDELKATIAEKDAEILQWTANSRENKLIAESCNHDLIAAKAHIERLRESLANALCVVDGEAYPTIYADGHEALAIPTSQDALRQHDQHVISNFLEREGKWMVNDAILRQHDAELVERMVSYMLKLDANATLVAGVSEFGNMLARGDLK